MTFLWNLQKTELCNHQLCQKARMTLTFSEPWDKPVDMEITLNLQWDEMFDQSE